MSTRIAEPAATMRKAPRQARSRATVDAIVEAAAQVLCERGWSGFTTNEVAEVAGVSIGSLYQYFPNKLALVAAMRRRHFAEVLAVLQGAADRSASPPQLVETLVDGLIAIHCNSPAYYQAMFDLPDPDGSRSTFAVFQTEYLGHYRAVIAAYRGRPADGIAAEILSSAIEGVIHNAARRGMLRQPEVRRELTRLVTLYLDGA